MREYELIIIGGGAAGMLAAIEGKKNGINRILVIEKDPILGGTLNSAGYPINKDKTVIGKVWYTCHSMRVGLRPLLLAEWAFFAHGEKKYESKHQKHSGCGRRADRPRCRGARLRALGRGIRQGGNAPHFACDH